jgi:hypothetical protein
MLDAKGCRQATGQRKGRNARTEQIDVFEALHTRITL